MKFTIPNGLIKAAIRKGGVSAMTSEAKNKDQLMTQPTLNCVKIHADDKSIVFESSVPAISSKFTIPVADGIKVDSEGGVCVLADWLLKSCESTSDEYTISFDSAVVEKVSDENQGEIKHTSKILMQALADKGKCKVKWTAPGYSETVFPEASYDKSKDPIISCNAAVFKGIMEDVIFSANLSDSLELLDNVAINREAGKMVMATCDGKRSVLKVIDPKSVKIGKGSGTTLVKAGLLLKAISAFDSDEELSLQDAGDGQNVVLTSTNLEFKISMAPTNLRKKFPSVSNMLAMETDLGFVVAKADLIRELTPAMAENSETAKYTIDAKKGISILTTNDGNGTTSEAFMDIEELPKSLKNGHIFMSTIFLLDMVKRIPGKSVKISFTEDERKIKVEDPSDPAYVYIMMRMLEQKGV
jgi:DNA polymerase III sliding clamp (beta) subunit (PCNA family)